MLSISSWPYLTWDVVVKIMYIYLPTPPTQKLSLMKTSGRPDQANTGLTEPDWSGNFYRTEPDLTEPDLIAYKFSNIPSFKVSETLNYEN